MGYLDTINNQIKTGDFRRLYLFYGGDAYLKNRYANRIAAACLPDFARDMNLDVIDGADYKADAVFDKCGMIPFLAEKRVIIIKNSKIFAGSKKDKDAADKPGAESVKGGKQKNEAEKTEKYLKTVPDTTVIIFIEESADKRLSLFKAAAKTGECIEFTAPDNADMIKWVTGEAKNAGASLSKPDAAFFLQITPKDMGIQYQEIQKLAACALNRENGEITKKDMLELTTKSLEASVFTLVDAIGGKDAKTALTVYGSLIFQKESPFMILAMMARQFRMILGAMDLKKAGKSTAETAKALGLWDFAVKNMIKQSANFTRETLAGALRDCLELDMNIKKGLIIDKLGVEMLIIKYAG